MPSNQTQTQKDAPYKFHSYVVEVDGVQSHSLNAFNRADAINTLIRPGGFFDYPIEKRSEAIVYATENTSGRRFVVVD